MYEWWWWWWGRSEDESMSHAVIASIDLLKYRSRWSLRCCGRQAAEERQRSSVWLLLKSFFFGIKDVRGGERTVALPLCLQGRSGGDLQLTIAAERVRVGGMSEMRNLKPLFTFGVVADIQYADKDDKGPDDEGRTCRYREATGKLERAIQAFNTDKQNLSFVLTLGDIIDGNISVEETSADFAVVLNCLEKLGLQAHHLLGNHCLNLPRETVMKKLGMPARYYRVDIQPGWALVVLDSMDLSIQWPPETQKYKEALEFLKDHPLVIDRSNQMVSWNGGIGAEQKIWLADVLQEAERNETKLIVAAHHPLLAGAAPRTHLMWNHEEILSMLLESSSVALFLCGHYHLGGYARSGNQHFVTLQGILEAPPETEAHAFVHVYDDVIIIDGHGFVESRELPIV